MLNDDTVIYSKSLKGETVTVTYGEVRQSDEMLLSALRHGMHRITDSARTNAEDKDSAEYHRVQQVKRGETWKQGGGNAVDAETDLYRQHLAAWAQTHLAYGKTEAAKAARKDEDKLLAETARAILKKKGDSTGKDRVAEAAEKLQSRIMKDVRAVLNQGADSIDI